MLALTVRSIWHLLSIAAVTAWGLLSWEFPLPSVFIGAGILIVAILLWALFLSPKPMLRVDRFAQGLFELLLVASAVAALLALDVHWLLAAVFGIIGAALGFIAGTTKEP